MSEQEKVDGTLFDFGTIAETQIMKVQNQVCLPYNPFTFDITLRIIKSIQPYQSNITFNINSGCKSIFGRKKTEVQHILKAPTVSSRHFSIDQNQKIYDLGSTKGTYFWVNRQNPVQIQKCRNFKIGKSEIIIEDVKFHQKKLTLKIDGKTAQFNKLQNPVLFGSHKRCQVRIQGKQYLAALDMANMRLHSFLQMQDFDCQQGVWQRLSSKKEESEGRQLGPQDIIMVYPYILKAEY